MKGQTQFRLGNYLKDKKGNFCMVEEINADGFKAPSIKGAITSLPNVPIVLDEDVISKIAKKYNKTYWLSLTNLKAEIHFEIYPQEVVTTIVGSFVNLILDEIKYLHQLQNLYFVLTGEELIIKL